MTKYSSAAGILTYQNTFIGNVRANAPSIYFANNLILGDGRGPVYAISTATSYSTSDFNGFRPNTGADHDFEWNSPPAGKTIVADSDVVKHSFKTLAELAVAGRDAHSIQVDYTVFAKVSPPPPDRSDIERVYAPEEFDFTLAPGVAAIDAGEVLPNINDGYSGKAPDLGAYEAGRSQPNYGPRTPVPGKPLGDGGMRTLAGPPA